MRLKAPFIVTMSLLAALVSLAPSTGCGAKKRKPPTIAELLDRARTAGSDEAQAKELTRVARLQLRSGNKSGASKTLSEARSRISPPQERKPRPAPAADGAEPVPEPAADEPQQAINPAIAAPLLVEIAAVYSELGEKGAARDVLKRAVALAAEIPDDVSRSALFATAGGIYGVRQGGIGDAAAARRELKKATDVAAGIEERFRAQALAAAAMGYVTAGLAKEAGDMVAALEESARSVESPRARAEALAAAGNVRAQSGDKEKATQLLGEAASTAKGIEGAENRTYALVAVADATSANGDRKAALKLIAEAEKSANKVGDPDAQENAKAKVRAAKGDIERRKT
ncbi:hypothetical protein EBR04_01135 [bacterium]|nr:hypothetical protein [bacterium]